ncbi:MULTISPECIES: FxsA family protein [Mumia]|uniref:FxsA family protein n=1 Tax=Mumia TaxID=1546255 RepID=UPI00142310CA|nr:MULTISPECIES: FxsA family protein [unclassified Mumia]QMW64652.1 FxsA family protein [Mumia sp. ZJ1417]
MTVRRGVAATFLLLPVIEIALAVAVSSWIGVGATIISLMALSLVGIVVIRETGRRGWQDLRLAARDGVPPEGGSGRGLTMLVGFLFAVPGYLTAVAGALLLLPPVRKAVRTRSRRWAERQGTWVVSEQFQRRTSGHATSPTVVQGEVVDD